jgi:hypothetical protein
MITAIFGLLGVIVGGALQILARELADRRDRRADDGRKRILRQMLDHDTLTWRKLSTCQRVIGADVDTTKRLLVEIGARGSESDETLW